MSGGFRLRAFVVFFEVFRLLCLLSFYFRSVCLDRAQGCIGFKDHLCGSLPNRASKSLLYCSHGGSF